MVNIARRSFSALSARLSGLNSGRPSWWAIEARLLLGLGLCALFGWFVYRTFLIYNLKNEGRIAAARLNFYAQSLEATLARHESMPWLLALEHDLAAVLEQPNNPACLQQANQYLETTQNLAGLSAAYVMNLKGDTLAASNWNLPITFVGQNYAYRPYFREAAVGKLGRFYGIGSTTGEAGYFLAAPIKSRGNTLGVVTIKANLNSLEDAFDRSGDMVLLADAEGVVFLASVPSWKYRSLGPLSEAALQDLRSTRQYANHVITPLVKNAMISPRTDTIRLPLPKEISPVAKQVDLLVRWHQIGKLGWQLVLLTNPESARRSATGAGVAAGFALAFALASVVYFRLRRLRQQDREEAQAALRRVHDELETRIANRTADLVTANVSLEEKVAALKQTENILREARDSAVQAGKLAVLGQMAAGMSHELNQPLAALTVLSDNARQMLERGQLEDTQENLGLISQMAARMGRIVKQLKSFSRKGAPEMTAVVVAEVVDYALLIVEPRRREVQAQIEVVPISPTLCVLAEPVRLEQVLVNLIRNGLDAIVGQPNPHIIITVVQKEEGIAISIRDNGPGIPAAVLPHLFEPFYTTKAMGQGLGLGLAISLAIVEGFGGKLEVHNASQGGADFIVTLSMS